MMPMLLIMFLHTPFHPLMGKKGPEPIFGKIYIGKCRVAIRVHLPMAFDFAHGKQGVAHLSERPEAVCLKPCGLRGNSYFGIQEHCEGF